MANLWRSTAVRVVASLWKAWAGCAQAVFGAWVWEAPRWYTRARGIVVNVHPRTLGVALIGMLILAAGGYASWRWYQLLPKPQFAAFSFTAPARTRIEEENARPDPLTVRFDRSVAALAWAGKPLPGGVSLAPGLEGTWRWLDDRVLEFRPKQDWPIGQPYKVTWDKSVLAPQVRLQKYGFEFSTASFAARISGAQFYQDPVNPGVKMGVFDVQFTHPVDPAEFERRVEVRLAGQKKACWGWGVKLRHSPSSTTSSGWSRPSIRRAWPYPRTQPPWKFTSTRACVRRAAAIPPLSH